MKNDPHNLSDIISGKLVIPQTGDLVYITADISDPAEFILIPLNDFSITTNFEEMNLIIPGQDDKPIVAACYVTGNNVFTSNDFTWIEEAQCWAYYPRP